MRKALLIGIDAYEMGPLAGCVRDARTLATILARNEDGSRNFDCRLLTSDQEPVTRKTITSAVRDFYAREASLGILYFSGHGFLSDTGGQLIPQDAKSADDGLSMRDILTWISRSPVLECVVILDCCFSGAFGDLPESDRDEVKLRKGVSVLAAANTTEAAMEINGKGVFTSLLCDALLGGACDLLGRVTIGSIYSHIDLSLSAFDQRPIFKAYLSNFHTVRRCASQIDPAVLRLLPVYFESPESELELSPAYEPEADPHDETAERTFAHLQRLRDVRLLVPVGEKHLYHAAVHSASCKLTALGRYFWRLAESKLV